MVFVLSLAKLYDEKAFYNKKRENVYLCRFLFFYGCFDSCAFHSHRSKNLLKKAIFLKSYLSE